MNGVVMLLFFVCSGTPDAGTQRFVKTATVAGTRYAYSKEDLELARYMDVLQQDQELLKNFEFLRILPVLEE